ncbi:hypothetical protein BDY24DRAFT_441362, partial [Mrakia frigida]|uniref:uncharacterized protein n=1 Tax=Mrakia frigida TaxID=29902 RepID=UPI003FCC0189
PFPSFLLNSHLLLRSSLWPSIARKTIHAQSQVSSSSLPQSYLYNPNHHHLFLPLSSRRFFQILHSSASPSSTSSPPSSQPSPSASLRPGTARPPDPGRGQGEEEAEDLRRSSARYLCGSDIWIHSSGGHLRRSFPYCGTEGYPSYERQHGSLEDQAGIPLGGREDGSQPSRPSRSDGLE